MEDNVADFRRARPRRVNSLAFFLGFLRHPDWVGSVIPSSRFLERRLIEVGEIADARLVVEFGPGTGGTTRAMLDALPRDAKLLAIEINPDFVSLLESIRDPRLIVHNGSAESIHEALAQHGLRPPDVVFSGIPFSTMPQPVGERILRNMWSSLGPGGRFVAYQFRDRVADLGRRVMGSPETQLELLNAPPTRIFYWRKPEAAKEKAAV